MLEHPFDLKSNSGRVAGWIRWLPIWLVVLSLGSLIAEGRIYWAAYHSDIQSLPRIAGVLSIANRVFALIAAAMLVLEIKRRTSPSRGAAYCFVFVCALTAGFVNPFQNLARADAVSRQNACVNNLRLIDSAKNQWALENHKNEGDTLTAVELRAYIGCGKGDLMPSCPDDGLNEFTNSYDLNPVGQPPSCKMRSHTHKLP